LKINHLATLLWRRQLLFFPFVLVLFCAAGRITCEFLMHWLSEEFFPPLLQLCTNSNGWASHVGKNVAKKSDGKKSGKKIPDSKKWPNQTVNVRNALQVFFQSENKLFDKMDEKVNAT
jgi:hypothetical protein